MKKTALPVTDVAFPTITICASGFHMTNVEKAVSDNFGRYSELIYPITKYRVILPCPKYRYRQQQLNHPKCQFTLCRWREENERNDGSKILEDMVDYMEVAFQIEPPRDKKSEPVKKKFGFAF